MRKSGNGLTSPVWATLFGSVLLIGTVAAQPPGAGGAGPGGAGAAPKKFEDFENVVKGAKVFDGLFRLHLKENHLYCEIKPHQLNRPYLCPISIARGMGMGGHTLNFDEQWVLLFKRVNDNIHLVRRNVRFQAKPGSPAAHAVETTYTDSVLKSIRIVTINPQQQSAVIDLGDIFMTDFAELGIGSFDSSRSTWDKVKTFPRNIEVKVAATYAGGGGGMFFFGDDSVIDRRGTTIVINYGLCELPEGGFQSRLADDRVGYFLSVVKDFDSDKQDTAFVRYVNRWRLERAEPVDPKKPNRLSAPKKKIVYWIEKSVPVEYRTFVRDGILEWNKAFEKIGFRDAIEVRQQEDEDFDPEDVNYSTFRWVNNDQGYAMGPSRANPLTGEIFDADIIFDGSMVRYFKLQHQLQTSASGRPELFDPPSLIEAGRKGWTLNRLAIGGHRQGGEGGWNEPRKGEAENAPDRRLLALRQGLCQCGTHRKYELGMAAMAMAAREQLKPGEKIPDDLIGQAIKEVTMHEVGHTLGLRHNFKASTMLKNEELHNTEITRKKGLVGSVMDYSPINLAPKGTKQGDYFTTTIGPYDYWAIEYAYKPLSGGTDGEGEELKKIARRGAETGHDYGTDEDLFQSSDPLINLWDLGSDPLKFGMERMQIAEEILKGVADKGVEEGEGYQRLRLAFRMLMGQYGNAAILSSQYIGGQYAHRDHHKDPSGREPLVPVKADRQREALKFLQQHILTDKPFQFSPTLLRRLAADRWMHWGNEFMFYDSFDVPVYQRILGIQRVALRHSFDPSVLNRIQNNALQCDKGEKPFTIAELFRGLTDAIWTDSAMKEDKGKKHETSIITRNLQREHLKNLSQLVIGQQSGGGGMFMLMLMGGGGGSAPPDARSLARLHLRRVADHITKALKDADNLEDTTRAHLEECQERIVKVLSASLQIRD